jgi:hypothetical protein
MIVQALDLQQEYTKFCSEHYAIKALLPTPNEWVMLHQLAYVLKPFKDKTEEVSKEMPSITKSLEVYWELDILLNNVKDRVGIFSNLESTIRNAVIASITKNSKYQRKMEKHVLLFVAHILDPRHKAELIREQMPNDSYRIINLIRKFLKAEYRDLSPPQPSELLDPLAEAETAKKPLGMSAVAWRFQQRKKASSEQNSASLCPTIDELDRYLDSTLEEWNDDEDYVRQWWKAHQSEYPILSQAARDILPCSASEVDVERLFSSCRDVIGIRRHGLKAETVRVLMLLKSCYTTDEKQWKDIINNVNLADGRNSILWKPALLDDLDDVEGMQVVGKGGEQYGS